MMNRKFLSMIGGLAMAASIFTPMHAQAAAENVAEAAAKPGQSVNINDSTGFVVLSEVVSRAF